MKIYLVTVVILLFLSLGATAQEESVPIGYPVVDQMEVKLFGAYYPQENIYQRLDRLETKIFGSPSNASLYDRVDRLSNTVIENRSPQQYYSAPNLSSNNPQEYSLILYDLEKKLLGTVYITDPVNTRLARLEQHVFSQSSDNYPAEERLQRLCAYADAQESDDYFDDQAQMQQYSKVATGVKVISILFMILQSFL